MHVGLLEASILQQEPPWKAAGDSSPSWLLGNRRAEARWECGCQSIRVCRCKMRGIPSPGQGQGHGTVFHASLLSRWLSPKSPQRGTFSTMFVNWGNCIHLKGTEFGKKEALYLELLSHRKSLQTRRGQDLTWHASLLWGDLHCPLSPYSCDIVGPRVRGRGRAGVFWLVGGCAP